METKLNPPLEWDGGDAGEFNACYYLDVDFIDDDDLEKFYGYTISPAVEEGRFYVNFPDKPGRDMNVNTYTLEEAHEELVACAIEDGALPANIRELLTK
jgi:hypothetical protein